jgi:uncharacterized repeat protein (TIGR03803 family)
MQRQTPSLGKFHFNPPGSVTGIATLFAMGLALSLLPMPSLRAQTAYTVIHNFTGGSDGATPYAGVTIDGAGNLYGTTYAGGRSYGVIYQLKLRDGDYTANSLYEFTDGADGAYPYDRVVFGPDRVLYGTTYEGGNDDNGVVFKLQPPPAACATVLCSWRETALFAFPANGSGGIHPWLGDVIFDGTGNMYGTTAAGSEGGGAVWELTPPGTWNGETLLNSFTHTDGFYADGGPILDSSGNLYGTTFTGGTNYRYGVVYQLVPSSGGWSENVLYNFSGGNDGSLPIGGLAFDASGNLYGAATYGGAEGGGTIFELSPSGSGWTFSVLHSFNGSGDCPIGDPGPGPWAQLTVDSAGNLYGTTCADGAHQYGNVFELSPSSGGWTYTDLYDFTGGSDGGYPVSNAVCDSAGSLYGTASAGGTGTVGVAWKISGVGCLPAGGAPFRP